MHGIDIIFFDSMEYTSLTHAEVIRECIVLHFYSISVANTSCIELEMVSVVDRCCLSF
jgi:hypothetical protein